jgi:hypothetical protein
MSNKIANAVLFQIVWIACVGGGGAGLWWLGPLAVVAFFWWQLSISSFRHSDLSMVLIAAPLGMTVDTLLIALDLLKYRTPGPWGPEVAPIWIVALWVAFVLTLNHSLAWLKGTPALALVVGGAAGPFSYWVGATTWRAVDFTAPMVVVLGALMIVWAVVTPALVLLADRLRVRRRGEASKMTFLGDRRSLPPAA